MVAAIIAILFGILDLVSALSSLPGLSRSLIDGILFLALGVLSLMFSMRVRRRYYATYAVLLLVFSILFLALALGFGYGLSAFLVGVLMLLGAIILMIGRGS